MNRFVHLTDLHLSPDFEAQGQQDTSLNVKNAIKMIQALSPLPEFVVVSGDLTYIGSEAEFVLAKELLDVIPVPVFSTLGNCDDREMFYKIFLPDLQLTNEPYNCSITLDSTIPKKLSGELTIGQLDWLSKTLELSPDIPKVIAIHHPPTAVAIPVLSSICLQNSEAFLKRIENKNVIAILCGHVHYNQMSFLGEIPCFISSGLHSHFDVSYKDGLRAMDNPSFNLCSIEDNKIVVQTIVVPSSGQEVNILPNGVMQQFIDDIE